MSDVLFQKANAIYYGPFGPNNTESARHLIGQIVLCANERKDLGEYAILRSIEKDNYVVELYINGRTTNRLWIVGYE